MTHTLSADGKTQTIKGTSNKPDDTTDDFTVVMKKVNGGSGWGGTWEDTDVKFTSPDEWEIQAYEGDGLSFHAPAYKDTLSMKFDGQDYRLLIVAADFFHSIGNYSCWVLCLCLLSNLPL